MEFVVKSSVDKIESFPVSRLGLEYGIVTASPRFPFLLNGFCFRVPSYLVVISDEKDIHYVEYEYDCYDIKFRYLLPKEEITIKIKNS